MTNLTSEHDRTPSNKFGLILPSDFRGANILLINIKEDDLVSDINRRNAGHLRSLETTDKIDVTCRFDYIYFQTNALIINQQLSIIRKILKICSYKFYIITSNTVEGEPSKLAEKIYLYFNKLRLSKIPDNSLPRYYKSLKNQFNQMFSIVKSIDYIALINSNSSCLVFEMRIPKEILVVSGPSGVGKSYFLEKMSEDEKYFKNFGTLNLSDYQILTSVDLKKSEGLELDKVLLHYNITRDPELDYHNYEYEPAHIIERSHHKTVYVLTCPLNTLIERVRNRAKGKRFWSRRIKVANSIIKQYSQPGMVKQLYVNWIDYCKKKGAKMLYIDVGSSDSVRIVPEKQALDIIDR